MKTQHTLGTWFAEDRFIRNIEGQLIAEVQECHQFEVQYQDGTLDIGEEEMPWEANARLIAAAPELMDALHKVLMALESVHNLYQMNTRKRIEQADDWAENAWNLIHKLTDQ